MHGLSKTILILISLIIIGAGSAFMSVQLGIVKLDDQIRNFVVTNQVNQENATFKNITFEVNQKQLLTAEKGKLNIINETTGELIFDNKSLGTITFGRAFSPQDLKLPTDKEKQAIAIALNDSKVKEILSGEDYNITKVQKISIATMNQTTLSENNVVVEIEAGNITYFINVDMLKKTVQGNIVPIPKIR